MATYTGNIKAPIYLNGTALPLYSDISERIDSNMSKIYSLDGTLTVDYLNNRRAWEIKWDYITTAQYDIIRGIYDRQFTVGNRPIFYVPSIPFAVNVLVQIPQKNIRWNGGMVENFSIVLEEFFAVS